jgi:hypothetical protein
VRRCRQNIWWRRGWKAQRQQRQQRRRWRCDTNGDGAMAAEAGPELEWSIGPPYIDGLHYLIENFLLFK